MDVDKELFIFMDTLIDIISTPSLSLTMWRYIILLINKALRLNFAGLNSAQQNSGDKAAHDQIALRENNEVTK